MSAESVFPCEYYNKIFLKSKSKFFIMQKPVHFPQPNRNDLTLCEDCVF